MARRFGTFLPAFVLDADPVLRRREENPLSLLLADRRRDHGHRGLGGGRWLRWATEWRYGLPEPSTVLTAFVLLILCTPVGLLMALALIAWAIVWALHRLVAAGGDARPRRAPWDVSSIYSRGVSDAAVMEDLFSCGIAGRHVAEELYAEWRTTAWLWSMFLVAAAGVLVAWAWLGVYGLEWPTWAGLALLAIALRELVLSASLATMVSAGGVHVDAEVRRLLRKLSVYGLGAAAVGGAKRTGVTALGSLAQFIVIVMALMALGFLAEQVPRHCAVAAVIWCVTGAVALSLRIYRMWVAPNVAARVEASLERFGDAIDLLATLNAGDDDDARRWFFSHGRRAKLKEFV